jgi:cytochrome b
MKEISMNIKSSSRAERGVAEPDRVLVWDVPVRLFHWLMVASFAGAYLTAESERWRVVHVTLGYTMAGLVLFRLGWGLVGTRYARFSQFVRGPAVIASYLRSLVRGKPDHFIGHNPAGAVAILALLGLALAVAASGWAQWNEVGGDWLEELHEALANIMLGLVAVHVAAVFISSRLHRENLVAAMVHGKKPGQPGQGIARHWNVLGIGLLAAVLGFWLLQWHSTPAVLGPDTGAAQVGKQEQDTHEHGKHGHGKHGHDGH